jgi:hypothetical protein
MDWPIGRAKRESALSRSPLPPPVGRNVQTSAHIRHDDLHSSAAAGCKDMAAKQFFILS